MLPQATNTAENPRPTDALDPKLVQQFITEQLPQYGQLTHIQQFKGGYSNLTYLLHFGQQQLVLRKAPNNVHIKGAHSMEREYQILQKLDGVFAAPKALVLCQNQSLLGTAFYIMQKIDGTILRAGTHTTALPASHMQQLCHTLVQNICSLHQINIQTAELQAIGQPQGYVQRQVDAWIQRYQNSQTEANPQAEQIINWLQNYQPNQQQPALLHNDYKYDNVIFDHNLQKIKAVLDWEMCTIGDPLMDLGAMLAYWVEPHEGKFMKNLNITWLPGNMTRQQVADTYARITGRDLTHILFYYVFGLFKNTVILQQIYNRWLSGSSTDQRFALLGEGRHELLSMATKALDNNTL
jgi:aminoglycoside phosphotransferase (APT) family kinase protein